MIEHILLVLAGFIKAVISSLGYPGIAVLMGIESACIPLPSEVIMPFAGYLVYAGRFSSLAMVATLGAIGCNLGSVLAYEVGAYGGRPLIERFGRYILMNRHDLDVSEKFFQKYGSITVFVGRLLPVVRTFIALPAGIARMPRGKFHLYTFVGSWPWCYALAWVGANLGERWDSDPRLKQWFHRMDAVIVLVLLTGIVYFVQSHWRNRVKSESVAD
ncbi:MAG TPA: DedA family protein [Candidatus Saccharimonadales bacterium]|nr:DedA family protein [Candidatus Saccharimonadales bacterium]